jgi:hypothetical protein
MIINYLQKNDAYGSTNKMQASQVAGKLHIDIILQIGCRFVSKKDQETIMEKR